MKYLFFLLINPLSLMAIEKSDIICNFGKKLHSIECILHEYDINDEKYNLSFDYQVGYLHGRRSAYLEIIEDLGLAQ